MKSCFISSADSITPIEDIIPVEVMDSWVKSYGTDEEHGRLILLANEAREKIERETGLRIGRRTFVMKTNHYPCNEILDIYPVGAIGQVEVLAGGSYVALDDSLYSLEQKTEKLYMILFAGALPSLPVSAVAVKITATAGCETLADLPATAVSAIRVHLETYFRDKMPAEVAKGVDAFNTCINHLRIWL